MKRTQNHRIESAGLRFVRKGWDACRSVRDRVARAKETVLQDYAESIGEHARILRLALNEAEALAWQTGYPDLFFPTLAAEKAQAAVKWHQRQHAVRQAQIELAFAE